MSAPNVPWKATVGRIGARGAASVLQALTLVVAARVAGSESFGLFVVVYSIAVFANAATGLGASTRALRSSADSDESAADVLFGIRVIASMGVASAGLVAALATENWIVLWAVVVASSDAFGEFAQNALAGVRRQTAASVSIVVQRLVPFLAVLLCIWRPTGLFPSYAAAQLAGAILVPVIARQFGQFRMPTLRQVSALRGYWFAAVVGQLSQLEPSAVSLAVSTSFAGQYGLAVRIARPLTIVSSALQSILVPELSALRVSRDFRSASRVLLRPIWVYAVSLTAIAPLIGIGVTWALGPEYRGSQGLITAMVIAAALSALAQGYQAILVALDRPALSGAVVAVGSVASLVLLFMLGKTANQYLWVVPIVTQVFIVGAMRELSIRGSRGAP